jgi:hypothetical protein
MSKEGELFLEQAGLYQGAPLDALQPRLRRSALGAGRRRKIFVWTQAFLER